MTNDLASPAPPAPLAPPAPFDGVRRSAVTLLGVVLCLFTLAEVNFPRLQPQSALAVFVGLGLVLCYLVYPVAKRLQHVAVLRVVDLLLAVASAACCAYVVVQMEPAFRSLWFGGQSLGDRAGAETPTDFAIAIVGLVLVLEATRRSIGWIVPALSLAFVAHSYWCYLANAGRAPAVPDWLLPHGGQNLEDIATTTFVQSLGVFGPAASVMFQYVFLFVVFGSFLEMSGATKFVIDFAERVFGRSPGGPAKVAVLGSGLMGSLSGSAVANAVTTGAFTIPMMRNAGFSAVVAGGITAAAASGGALMPPVMGAGAYMMLELVKPTPTFLEIARAALVPAILYYFSIYMIVHFYSRKIGIASGAARPPARLSPFEASVFFGALGTLILLLVMGFSAFRAVTGSLIVILLCSPFRAELGLSNPVRAMALGAFAVFTLWFGLTTELPVDDPTPGQVFGHWLQAAIVGTFGLLAFGLVHPAWRPRIVKAFVDSSRQGIALVAASACVGIIIGIVQQTGIAADFSSVIKDVVESNLFLALFGIMCCSLVLGMGVPSVVCYLLLATLMGSLLGEMGVIPLAAHMFIFYFGMMSMVTPPVALAGYAAASIADAPIMATCMAAFRFSLVGFTLPFMFVYRPELLLLAKVVDAEGNVGSRELQLFDWYRLFDLGTYTVALPYPHWADVIPASIHICIATVGIIALAAGLAGYLFTVLRPETRVGMLLGSACLLSPDVTWGDVPLGMYVNIVGTSLVVLTMTINFVRSRRQRAAADSAAAAPGSAAGVAARDE